MALGWIGSEKKPMAIRFPNQVDLDDFQKITFSYGSFGFPNQAVLYKCIITLGVYSDPDLTVLVASTCKAFNKNDDSEKSLSLDVSELDGSCYLGISITTDNGGWGAYVQGRYLVVGE